MPRTTPLFTPVLIGGCLIILVGFAVRSSFGVFQIPIAEEFGWLRSEFSLAIAIQNLAWGIGQPIFGAIAERIGECFAGCQCVGERVGKHVEQPAAPCALVHRQAGCPPRTPHAVARVRSLPRCPTTLRLSRPCAPRTQSARGTYATSTEEVR